jgi:hypothetical protein
LIRSEDLPNGLNLSLEAREELTRLAVRVVLVHWCLALLRPAAERADASRVFQKDDEGGRDD